MTKSFFQKELTKIVKIALAEDCAISDITSDYVIKSNSYISFEIKAREDIIFCGKEVMSEVFSQLQRSKKFCNTRLNLKIFVKDGDVIMTDKPIACGIGDAKLIFAAERVLLNLIQHLSGIATSTRDFVKKLNNEKINILDTRKTIPGLRILQKQAVLAGGGKNHRMNLSDRILIKDNHIAVAGGAKEAIEAIKICSKSSVKKFQKIKIEIECDTFKQVAEALESGPEIIMLDNMKISEIKKSAQLIRSKSKKIQIEISGGVNEKNIQKFSKLDIDFISIGSLTHSVRAVDIGLDVI